MSEFLSFIELGFKHITDLEGYDHLLFVIALCAAYTVAQWKQVLVLVTAFTIGHSVTLALAALNVVDFNIEAIEFLIPVTILATCISNFWAKHSKVTYLIACIFGFIHGMGFSFYLRSLLGKSSTIIKQLFAFNIGLELGQILIVMVFMTVAYFMIKYTALKQKYWTWLISFMVGVVAIVLIVEKWPL